jgi:outer membrane protein
MTREIQELKIAQFNAEGRGDRNQVMRLENEVYQKSEYLKEYFKIKTAELEDRKKKLTESEAFLNQISDEIRSIAESEGYSMVLKTNKEILWYSPSVDITDKLIQNLHAKAGR